MRRVGLSIVPRRALYFELMKSLTHSPDGNDGDQGPGREPVSVGAVAVGAGAALGEPGGVLGYIGTSSLRRVVGMHAAHIRLTGGVKTR